ncbi:unnamed protein product [Didymodactylos carnosus]|uniref:Pentatricopeptide repeat-containing protein n=1 Tax=Didymodactylos carnosus TaxID=1234261 RepID=A0A8S2CKD5_9BILA|nr:unnamed protein product [Didymodactylos carnosus]CAF3498052.1 unnamed protein product [Didymodactylos carnosus]
MSRRLLTSLLKYNYGFSSADRFYSAVAQPDVISKSSASLYQRSSSYQKQITENKILTSHMKNMNKNGEGSKALALFDQKIQRGIIPDQFTLTTVLNVCADMKKLIKGKQIHEELIRTNPLVASDNRLRTSLMHMYGQCGDIQSAEKIFYEIERPTEYDYSILMKSYDLSHMYKKILDLYDEMKAISSSDEICPGAQIYAYIIKACKNLNAEERGRLLHQEILYYKLNTDHYLATLLIDMYSKFHDLKACEVVFQAINPKLHNLYMYSTMMKAYTHNDMPEKTLEMYKQIKRDNLFQLDEVGYLCVLNAYAKIGMLKLANQIYCELPESVLRTPYIQNTLIDLFGKCGDFRRARQIFDNLNKRQSGKVYNTMINVYGINGRGQDALKIFQQMKLNDIKLDFYTYVLILRACQFSKLIQEAKQIFQSMNKQYRSTEIYVIMIDIYSQCGEYDKCELLIQEFEQVFNHPLSKLWYILFASINSNSSLNEEQRKNKLQDILDRNPRLNVENPDRITYRDVKIQLWEHENFVRRLGDSLTLVNNTLHTFVDNDERYPEIYNELTKLEPEIDRTQQCTHSLKLALVYNLLGNKYSRVNQCV